MEVVQSLKKFIKEEYVDQNEGNQHDYQQFMFCDQNKSLIKSRGIDPHNLYILTKISRQIPKVKFCKVLT